jgi:hypothetical protein
MRPGGGGSELFLLEVGDLSTPLDSELAAGANGFSSGCILSSLLMVWKEDCLRWN